MANRDSSEAERYEHLRGLLARARQLRQAIEANKIAHYRPLPKQAEFHAAGDAQVRLVYGGNRSGKTTCGAMEAIAHSLGYRPWLPEDHPDRVVRLCNGDPIPVPNVGRIVAENFEINIVQTIHPKIKEWAPAGEIVNIQRSQRGVPIRYDWRNGSVVHLMSYEQDDEAFEGPSGHWGWLDEPAPQRKFNGIRRGLIDFDGHCWMTMTPLAQPWITQVLANRANEPGSHVRMFNFDIWDNCIENGGTLTRDAIEGFLKDLPAAERAAREHGKALHLAGLVFPEWAPEPPFWVTPFEIPSHWPRVRLIDPHPRKPVAVLWAAISPKGVWYLYRALFDESLDTIRAVAEAIHEAEGWLHGGERFDWSSNRKIPVWRAGPDTERVALTIIDTSANEHEKTSGETVAEQFGIFGIDCTDAYKRNKDAGLKAIRELLKRPNGVPVEFWTPGIVTFDTCLPVKDNFLNFIWDRWGSSKQNELKGERQEVVKNYDDFIDLIRYLLQMRLTYAMLRSKAFRRELDDDDDKPRPTRNRSWNWRGR